MNDEEFKEEQLTTGRRLVYFSAERTLMSWVRAALGLMALGFVIDRFSLVLRQIAPNVAIHFSKAFSFWGGTLVVFLGAILAVVAAIRYTLFAVHYHRDYQHDQSTRPGHGILLGVIFTVIVAVVGFVVAGFLLVAGD
jgi:putative membrane protein